MPAINGEKRKENQTTGRGTILRCPICKAEITVLAPADASGFRPRCCSTAMEKVQHRAFFYICEICGAEVASVSPECGDFTPHCCRQPMTSER